MESNDEQQVNSTLYDRYIKKFKNNRIVVLVALALLALGSLAAFYKQIADLLGRPNQAPVVNSGNPTTNIGVVKTSGPNSPVQTGNDSTVTYNSTSSAEEKPRKHKK